MGRGEHFGNGEVPAEYKIGREGQTVQPSDAPFHRQKKEKFIKTDEINPESVVEREGVHLLDPEEMLLAKERGEIAKDEAYEDHGGEDVEILSDKEAKEAEGKIWGHFYAREGKRANKIHTVSEGTRHLEDVHEKKVGEVPRRLEKKYSRARYRVKGGKPKGAHPAKVPPYKTAFRETA